MRVGPRVRRETELEDPFRILLGAPPREIHLLSVEFHVELGKLLEPELGDRHVRDRLEVIMRGRVALEKLRLDLDVDALVEDVLRKVLNDLLAGGGDALSFRPLVRKQQEIEI